MASLHRQDLITAQQLARLSLHRFYCAASVTTNYLPREGKATMSSPGAATDTRDGQAVALAWDLAQTAQSCAYLAEELQVAAEKYCNQTLTCRESTYKLLLDSLAIFQDLLAAMQQSYREVNVRGDYNVLPALSGHMAEEIRYMLAHGAAIIMAECMTSRESQETPASETAGDTR